MTRVQSLVQLLEAHPDGMKLRDIVTVLYGSNTFDQSKSWSNYMGTYHTLKNHRHLFVALGKGCYAYRPEDTAPNFAETTIEELILDVVKFGEELRANEIWHRILNAGTSVSYKTVFYTLKNSVLFYKKDIHYTLVDEV